MNGFTFDHVGRGFVYGRPRIMSTYDFGITNLAAGQTEASTFPWANNQYGDLISPRACSLVGIAARLTAAAAGSTCVATVRKNGVNQTTVTIQIGQQNAWAALSPGSIVFQPGDLIHVRVTTGAGWTATTADLSVMLEMLEA